MLPGRVASMLRGASKWLSAVLLENVGRPEPVRVLGRVLLCGPGNEGTFSFAFVHLGCVRHWHANLSH